MVGDEREGGSRERVVAAATAMVSENVAASLSVRKVADRAGVSVGSLRYHFPTQRDLHREVMSRIYSRVFSDDRIRDRSVPARDRLVECLRQVLAPAGVGAPARAEWRTVFETFMAGEPTEEAAAAHAAAVREGRRRVEYWLVALGEEGALADGDTDRTARFLLTVLNGLSIERALPAEEPVLASETETLYTAVDAVLAPRTG